MSDTEDERLAEIVRRARCRRCGGKGFRLAPVEDLRGDRISGKFDKLDCPDCGGNGIRLGICRRLALELARHARGPMAEDSG